MASTSKTISFSKKVDLGIDEILSGISELETKDLEKFMRKIRQLIIQRSHPTLSERESELLLKIQNVIPATLQERYATLIHRMEDEKITPKEHKELLKLVEKLEAKYVERLKYLIELADIRNISLDELMKQLHLNVQDK